MTKTTLLIATLMLGSLAAGAQASSKEVDLTWTASSDSTATTPGTVTVFRSPGACPATGIPTGAVSLTTTAPAGGPYQDKTVTTGTWCYYLTATIGTNTSGPSASFGASVGIAPPTNLKTVTIQITIP